jgi:hypothetical protein
MKTIDGRFSRARSNRRRMLPSVTDPLAHDVSTRNGIEAQRACAASTLATVVFPCQGRAARPAGVSNPEAPSGVRILDNRLQLLELRLRGLQQDEGPHVQCSTIGRSWPPTRRRTTTRCRPTIGTPPRPSACWRRCRPAEAPEEGRRLRGRLPSADRRVGRTPRSGGSEREVRLAPLASRGLPGHTRRSCSQSAGDRRDGNRRKGNDKRGEARQAP